MARLLKAINRVNVVPVQIPMTYPTELEQIILKLIGNQKDPAFPKQS